MTEDEDNHREFTCRRTSLVMIKAATFAHVALLMINGGTTLKMAAHRTLTPNTVVFLAGDAAPADAISATINSWWTRWLNSLPRPWRS